MKYLVVYTCIFFLMSCNVNHLDESGDFILEKGGDLLWYNQPSGFFYEGKEKRTYLTWMDNHANVEICYYDEKLNKLSGVKKIKKWKYLDDHGQPVIHILQNGKYKGHILILLNLHNSPLTFVRSSKVESIETFTTERTIDSSAVTYPSIIENKEGGLMIFYKKNVFEQGEVRTRALFYRYSNDGGDTWSSEIEFLNFGKNTWVYSIAPVIKNEIIHIAFSIKDSLSTKVKDAFYIKSKNWGDSWENENSFQLRTPIRSLENKVYQTSENYETRVWDLKIDEFGNPIIGFIVYNEKKGFANVAQKLKNKWNIIPVNETENVYYPTGIAIDEKKPFNVFVAEKKNGMNSICEKRYDSITNKFEFVKYISLDTTKNQVRPQIIRNYGNLKLIWVEVIKYKNYQDFNTNIKAYLLTSLMNE